MKTAGIIPARYQSSRFPGKPLADLCGMPMIWWVYQQCLKVKELDEVYVATDDKRIAEVCRSLNIKVIMTSDGHRTGTDRIGEAASRIAADLYVNIQGDEPLLEPEVIREAILPFYSNPDLEVTNLMTKIKNPVDAVNFTVPKVITNRDGIGVYLTRAAAPFPKARAEEIEDIEILRFIENGYRVQYIEVESETVAVDTENDLERVRGILEKRMNVRSGGGAELCS